LKVAPETRGAGNQIPQSGTGPRNVIPTKGYDPQNTRTARQGQAFPRVDRDFVSDRYRAWWQAPTLDDITDEDLRRQSAGLAALGPGATYEFCRGLLNGRDIIESLADFERLDPGVLAYLGGDRLPIAEALQ
jgi:hypothetical protein